MDFYPVLTAFSWSGIFWALGGCLIAFLALLMIIAIVFLQRWRARRSLRFRWRWRRCSAGSGRAERHRQDHRAHQPHLHRPGYRVGNDRYVGSGRRRKRRACQRRCDSQSALLHHRNRRYTRPVTGRRIVAARAGRRWRGRWSRRIF